MRLVRPFGKYFSASVPVPTDFRTADAHLTGLINGTDGGTWAPESPIVIGGAGLEMNFPPTCVSTRTRVVRMGVHEYGRTSVSTGNWTLDYAAGTATGTIASTRLFMPITRIHDGATLSLIRVFFKVPTGKLSLPSIYPRLTVWRESPTTGTDYLLSGVSEAYAAPASLSAYINGGNPNVLTMTPDQNNVIDRTNYSYNMVFDSDNVATAPFNSVLGVELTYSSIADYTLP